jgi:hypothetical protein
MSGSNIPSTPRISTTTVPVFQAVFSTPTSNNVVNFACTDLIHFCQERPEYSTFLRLHIRTDLPTLHHILPTAIGPIYGIKTSDNSFAQAYVYDLNEQVGANCCAQLLECEQPAAPQTPTVVTTPSTNHTHFTSTINDVVDEVMGQLTTWSTFESLLVH